MKTSVRLVKRANRLLERGHYYLSQKKPKKALDYFHKVQKIMKKGLWDERVFASVLNDKGAAYFLQSDYKNSIAHLKRSLKMKRKIGNMRFMISTLMNLAFSYRANCQYDDSLSALYEVRRLSKSLGDVSLTKKVDGEIDITNLAKAKKPMVQIADLRIVTKEGISMSLSDVEHLPNLFNELTARIEDMCIEILNPLEARASISFSFENVEKEIVDPYEGNEWKRNRPEHLKPRIEGSTPNFAVFSGPGVYLTEKDTKIADEEGHVIKFDSREQLWNIFVPDSYPLGGFTNPMPICERLMFFSGTGRIFYWKLCLRSKYNMKLGIKRRLEEEPFRFGLLFPFKKVKISVSGLCIELKGDPTIDQGYLKRIPYRESRKSEVQTSKFLDFYNFREIYAFEGDGIYRLEKFDPTFTIESKDFEVLCFEIHSPRHVTSKLHLFPILRRDLDFRNEIGNEKYAQVIQEVRELPEKCQPHTTSMMCRECATQIKKLCIVNLLGIVCDSDVLPHHGFEYSDLLIKISNEKTLIIPVIVKGPAKITWGKDRGLTRQLLEKFRDEKVEVVVIATSGQIGNRLKIGLEHLADVHGRSLVFLTDRDLAQFLAELRQLHS